MSGRHDKLLALSNSDAGLLQRITAAARMVVLVLDGLQTDVSQEVRLPLRDVPGGEAM